jgi:hypothetical protein
VTTRTLALTVPGIAAKIDGKTPVSGAPLSDKSKERNKFSFWEVNDMVADREVHIPMSSEILAALPHPAEAAPPLPFMGWVKNRDFRGSATAE